MTSNGRQRDSWCRHGRGRSIGSHGKERRISLVFFFFFGLADFKFPLICFSLPSRPIRCLKVSSIQYQFKNILEGVVVIIDTSNCKAHIVLFGLFFPNTRSLFKKAIDNSICEIQYTKREKKWTCVDCVQL